jgi:hypothetical protein
MKLILTLLAFLVVSAINCQPRQEIWNTYTSIEYFNVAEKKYAPPTPHQFIVIINESKKELTLLDSIYHGFNVFTILSYFSNKGDFTLQCYDTAHKVQCTMQIITTETQYIFEVVYNDTNKYRCTSIKGKEDSKFTSETPPKNYSGVWEIFADGKLTAKIRYRNGIKDGHFYYYYPNGKTKLEGQYLNGVLNYSLTEYYENGDYKSISSYKLGEFDGKTEYYEGGKMKSK